VVSCLPPGTERSSHRQGGPTPDPVEIRALAGPRPARWKPAAEARSMMHRGRSRRVSGSGSSDGQEPSGTR